MADYREISQQYAQGGIKAVILLNSGAVVATLSQFGSISNLMAPRDLGISLLFWIAGIGFGVFVWIFGFVSTRFVDRAERGAPNDLVKSDKYMFLGLFSLASALLCFLFASARLACTLL